MEPLEISKVPFKIKDEKELTEIFLKTYTHTDWLYKIYAIDILLKKFDYFEKDFEKNIKIFSGGFDAGGIKRALKTEIFFTAYHITEALFALIYSFHTKPSNPWLLLSSYKGKQLKEYVETLEDILNEKFILEIIFAMSPEKYKLMNKQSKKGIKQSISFLMDYLPKLAHFFNENQAYLAYKHGLRSTHGGFEAKINGKTFKHGDCVGYIEKLFSDASKKHKYELRLQELEYERMLKICIRNHGIIRNIIKIRNQVNEIKKGKTDKRNIGVILFEDKVTDYFE